MPIAAPPADSLRADFTPATEAPRPPQPGAAMLVLSLGFLGFAAVRAPATMPFRIDPLGLVAGALVGFVALAVAAFAARHMRASGRRAFSFRAAALVAATLVFALADHVMVFAAGWAATGLLLARLIGHAENWAEADEAARRTRGLFMATDAALVAALALLSLRFGTASIAGIVERVGDAPAFSASFAAALIGLAVIARCALPPFSGWLLSSMTAPTPVSALMHAGLVNAGGLVVMRFAPLFEAAPLVRAALAAAGLAGALYGAGIMLVRPDVKRALAGSTVSQMGFMILCCALGAYAAALWHLVAHGLFKAWLFLGSGSNARAALAKPDRTTGGRAVAAAAATLAALTYAGAVDPADPAFVPVALATVTAFLAMLALPSAMDSRSGQVRALLLGLALLGLHALGLGAALQVIGREAPPLLPAAGHAAIVAGFALVLVWQGRKARAAAPLSPALYVRLINAGTPASATPLAA